MENIWRENSSDDISGKEGSSSVSISSKPKIATTMVDYGKNVENVRAIISAIGNLTEPIEESDEEIPEIVTQTDDKETKIKINEIEKEEI